jgi:hypothetical protein
MASKPAKWRIGGRASVATQRPFAHRRAGVLAVRPAVKLGWRIGEFVVRRRARGRIERFRGVGKTAASFAVIYGPMAAEVLGFVEPPKPKRRVPAFAAGVVIGAGAMYVVARDRRA